MTVKTVSKKQRLHKTTILIELKRNIHSDNFICRINIINSLKQKLQIGATVFHFGRTKTRINVLNNWHHI